MSAVGQGARPSHLCLATPTEYASGCRHDRRTLGTDTPGPPSVARTQTTRAIGRTARAARAQEGRPAAPVGRPPGRGHPGLRNSGDLRTEAPTRGANRLQGHISGSWRGRGGGMPPQAGATRARRGLSPCALTHRATHILGHAACATRPRQATPAPDRPWPTAAEGPAGRLQRQPWRRETAAPRGIYLCPAAFPGTPPPPQSRRRCSATFFLAAEECPTSEGLQTKRFWSLAEEKLAGFQCSWQTLGGLHFSICRREQKCVCLHRLLAPAPRRPPLAHRHYRRGWALEGVRLPVRSECKC